MHQVEPKPKSPMTLAVLIACLVIGTMVMISNYFFRPSLEIDLKNKVISIIYPYNLFNPLVKVEGRDVILQGIVENKAEAEKIEAEIYSISGVNQLHSELIIK